MPWKCVNKRWLLHKGDQENCRWQRSINRKISFWTRKLKIELRKKLVWLRDLDTKQIEVEVL